MAANDFANLVRTVLDNSGLPSGTAVGGTFGVAAGTGSGPTRQHTVFVENEEILVTRAGDVYTVVARLAPVNHGAGAVLLHDVSARDMKALMALLPQAGVGEYLVPWNAIPATPTNALMSEGVLAVVKYVIPERIKVDALACSVVVAGSAGASIRMGLYADDGTDKPASAAPIAESAVVGTSTGDRVAVLGAPITIEPGIVWGGAVCQGGAVTRPNAWLAYAPLRRQTTLAAALQGNYFVTAVAGALPSAPAWAPLASAHTLMGLRISALNT